MAGADEVELQVLDLVEPGAHVFLERAHDHREVVLEGVVVVLHLVVEHPLVAKVRPQKVAGEEDAVFFEVGEHRIGPVQKGRYEKSKRLAAQLDGLSVGDDDGVQFTIGDVLREDLARPGQHHL